MRVPPRRVLAAALIACLAVLAAVALVDPDRLSPWVQAAIPLAAALAVTFADRRYFYGPRRPGR